MELDNKYPNSEVPNFKFWSPNMQPTKVSYLSTSGVQRNSALFSHIYSRLYDEFNEWKYKRREHTLRIHIHYTPKIPKNYSQNTPANYHAT